MWTTPALLLLVFFFLASPSQAAAQPTLAAALELYASAAYDDALVALEAVPRESASAADRRQIDQHRMFCLMALGRLQAAETVAAALLEAHPDFTLAERDAAPRVRAMFEATRRRVLPKLARRTYADAKQAFDDGQWVEARRGFLALERMLTEAGPGVADPTLADLRTLSDGFLRLVAAALDGPASSTKAAPLASPGPIAARELPSVIEVLAARTPPREAPPNALVDAGLARASDTTASPSAVDSAATSESSREEAAAPAVVTPSPTAVAPVVPVAPPAAPAAEPVVAATTTSSVPPPFTPLDGVFTYDWRDRDVVPPVTLAQPVSGWWGSRGAPAPGTQLGAVDVVIDEQGRVTDARIYLSVNRVFDTVLLQSVSQWRFEPATKDGRPVKYRRVTGVVAGR